MMLLSDARTRSTGPTSTFDRMGNVNSINIDMMTEIQKEIDPYDMISLVFLLYDVPDTALQRLIIYQRVYKDCGGGKLDLLVEWARSAQVKATWKYEFLEALITCQLYNIVRNLGFNVCEAKKIYEDPNQSNNFINPMKKKLYELCENIQSENLLKLKKTLMTYKIETMEYEHCELIFLDLMCKKFITLQRFNYGSQPIACEFNVEKLVKIIENFEGLENFAEEMRMLESRSRNQQPETSPGSSTSASRKEPEISIEDDKVKDKCEVQDFDDLFKKVENELKEFSLENLQSDSKMQSDDVYTIKNPTNVGVCYIINQETFYPSKSSIENNHCKYEPLPQRGDSTKDKEALTKTMRNLNFEVISRDNQDHKTMIEDLKSILKYRVHQNHSIFMLCILSHGTKGYVYAADSVKVKIEYIENIFDADDVMHLRNMPKVIIVQACQVYNDNEHPDLIADAPQRHYIKKSDIILYLATAPGYEAYRLYPYGSIFIQFLCDAITEWADKIHLYDLFTKVSKMVRTFCEKLESDQLPKIDSTLMKSLYLKKIR